MPSLDRKSQDGVISFYDGASVFITGGSGFIGKALIEKLLRTCMGIHTIYILLRGKRNVSFEQRHSQLMKNQIFDIIRETHPKLLDKVVPIQGDVAFPMLGISPQDQQIIAENVNIVIHSAATVNFNERLSDAVRLNMKGTKSVLELCCKIKNLKSVVHVSSAYSNANRAEIDEKIYKSSTDPETLIRWANDEPDVVDTVSLDGHPNTYTFTKSLAENLVSQHFGKLPITIVRPSMVSPAVSEPFPGWLDKAFGTAGSAMEIYRGSLRTGYIDKNRIIDLVPVDFVVNTCIAAAWHHTTLKTTEVSIYNYTSGQVNPIMWEDFVKAAIKVGREYPSKYTMMYPNFKFTHNRMVNAFWDLFSHQLPNFFYDLILWVKGEKPIMMELAKKIKSKIIMIGEFFACRTWIFSNENIRRMMSDLKDKNEDTYFPLDLRCINWTEYLKNYVLGIRQYVLKESMDTLPVAMKKLKRFYYVHVITNFFTGYYFTD